MRYLQALLLITIFFVFSECRNDRDEIVTIRTQGYISSEFAATSHDSTYFFNEKIKYNQYRNQSQSIYSKLYHNYIVEFTRENISDGGFMAITFRFNDDDMLAYDAHIEVSFYGETQTEILNFYSPASLFEDRSKMNISDFSFDPVTHRIKGKYTCVSEVNSTGRQVLLAGDFDVILFKSIRPI